MCYLNSIYIIGFASLIWLFFRRAYYQFNLLKVMYPHILSNKTSYLKFAFSLTLFEFNVYTILWYTCPIYFLNKNINMHDIKSSLLHDKLIRNRKFTIVAFLVFLTPVIISLIEMVLV